MISIANNYKIFSKNILGNKFKWVFSRILRFFTNIRKNLIEENNLNLFFLKVTPY
jgi:hypothetical protein